MEFEDWWKISKIINTKNKYLVKKGWIGAIENNPIEKVIMENDTLIKENDRLIKENEGLKERIKKLKEEKPNLLITEPEPNIRYQFKWIQWWRKFRKINGLSYTIDEAKEEYEFKKKGE